MLTLGSFFDGIGGWLLAAKHAGVEPVWSCEIDPFPAAVSRHHFPEVLQFGDITKIKVEELPPVDIICAGSPCQDLSVAGKRAGLAGERSGLFVYAIRLIRELRRRTGKPRYFVWENVPGAFSSNKGLDFKAVLESISETEIPMPEGGKWATAGYVEWGGTSSLAWRTLDAQYFGVPQRRRRIFLVADFGSKSADKILFEPASMPRDFEESKGEGEDTASGTGGSSDSTSRSAVLKMRGGKPGGGKGPLVSKEMSLCLGCNNDQTLFEAYQQHGYRESEKAGSLTAGCNDHVRGDAPLVTKIYNTEHADEVIREMTGGKVHSLRARMGTGGGNAPMVHQYCLNDQGGGVMDVKDVSYTLNTVDRHAVAVHENQRGEVTEHDKAGALTTNGGKPGQGYPCVRCVGNGQLNQVELSDKVGALNTMHDQQCIIYRQGGFADYDEDKKAGHLRASGGDLGGGSENLIVGKSDASQPEITKE